MPGYVVPITVAALVAVAVGAVIFIVFRLYSGQKLTVSWPFLFQVYLYLMSLLALLVVIGGMSTLVRAGMGTALGKGFSYSSPQMYELRKPPAPAVPVGAVRPPVPPETQELSPEEMEQA
ncbi:MAG: hypothetical protein Q8O76_03930, partial [Chloroflexota bacterium]|nr:hypothetical protein [Chloroflexota bacterium]